MFDIGMSELLLIGIVALIVIGPKDLPGLFHTLGRFTAKMRALGREFTNAMNAAARESGVDDVAKGLKDVANPKKFGLDKLNDAADRFEKWDPTKPSPAPKPAKPAVDPARAADVEKIRAATEKAGQARLDREAAAKAAGEAPTTTTTPATTSAGATVAPTAAKSAAPKAAAPKAAAARKPAAKAPAAKPPAAKKPAARKPAAKPAAPKAETE